MKTHLRFIWSLPPIFTKPGNHTINSFPSIGIIFIYSLPNIQMKIHSKRCYNTYTFLLFQMYQPHKCPHTRFIRVFHVVCTYKKEFDSPLNRINYWILVMWRLCNMLVVSECVYDWLTQCMIHVRSICSSVSNDSTLFLACEMRSATIENSSVDTFHIVILIVLFAVIKLVYM